MADADLSTGVALLIIVVAAVLRWVWDQATGAAGLPFPMRPPKPLPPPPAPPPVVHHHRNGSNAAHRNGRPVPR